ncbi:MAG TPA: lactate utilization protein [bacterium]|nr:lactate utilization protein [bacterium]
MIPAPPDDRPPTDGHGEATAAPMGEPEAPSTSEHLAALRRLKLRIRARARGGLLDEAVETMTGLGFEVGRCASGEDLVNRVREIVPRGATVVYQPCVVGRGLRLDEVLRSEGRALTALPGDGDPPAPNGSWREHLLAAQFGITGAQAIVADTGSLVLAEDLGFGRAASNVPPTHIALVTADSVVEQLLDAAALARGYAALHLRRPVPRYLSLISGPSKTADIGFTLVRGMHGPRVAHVLIWDGAKSEGTDDAALRIWVLA